jgi:hypothetical protein
MWNSILLCEVMCKFLELCSHQTLK